MWTFCVRSSFHGGNTPMNGGWIPYVTVFISPCHLTTTFHLWLFTQSVPYFYVFKQSPKVCHNCMCPNNHLKCAIFSYIQIITYSLSYFHVSTQSPKCAILSCVQTITKVCHTFMCPNNHLKCDIFLCVQTITYSVLYFICPNNHLRCAIFSCVQTVTYSVLYLSRQWCGCPAWDF